MLASELTRLNKAVTKLTMDIEKLDAVIVPEIFDALKRAQRQRDTVVAQLENLTKQEEIAETFDLKAWMAEEGHVMLVDLEETLHADPVTSRGLLRACCSSPSGSLPISKPTARSSAGRGAASEPLGRCLAGDSRCP